jgi:uncharacterized protein (TIGR02611 family)
MSRTDTPGPKAPTSQRFAGVARARARIRALPGGWLAWRIGVTVVGVAVIIGGIILLPLPGPGWLIIFAGLGILATEYAWAARLLGYARAQVSRWTKWITRLPRWQRNTVLAVLIVVVLAIIGGAWWVYRQL